MQVWNLGSINIDRFYRLTHFPAAGESLAAESYAEGLGGKGANMSVAIARAAARVCHIGAVGNDGRWARDRLMEYGVDVSHIDVKDGPTGHANINVDANGENQIILYPGANGQLSENQIGRALANADTADILLMQNETNAQVAAATVARQLGLSVAYAAAPFDPGAVEAVLPSLDYIFLNEVEAEQLSKATGKSPDALPVQHVIVTRGADGADWFETTQGQKHHVRAYDTEVIDTTGAGDTFTGYTLAGVARGMPMAQALDLGAQAAALMVSRSGTADVIPDLKDIEDARFSSR